MFCLIISGIGNKAKIKTSCGNSASWSYSETFYPLVDNDGTTCLNSSSVTSDTTVYVGKLHRAGTVQILGENLDCTPGGSISISTMPEHCSSQDNCNSNACISVHSKDNRYPDYLGLPDTWDSRKECWFLCRGFGLNGAYNDEVISFLRPASSPNTICRTNLF